MLENVIAPYLVFLAKTVTVVVALGAVVLLVVTLLRQIGEQRGPEHLAVRELNERFRDLADTVSDSVLSDKAHKKWRKSRSAERKAREKTEEATLPRVFVLNFDGDLQAHAVESLREEISTVLQTAREGDEVLLRLESEGGLVHAYGLAASQLARLKARAIRLTVSVDKVAASGGYLMACVADRIIAAPFAILGSIGVIAQLPNFNRLLKKASIDYELHTAGEYKRTLTLLGENTDAARAKFRTELEETHALFKHFVAEHRPQLDIARVATGEHWFGSQALGLQLIDSLQTSDDFLLERLDTAQLIELRYTRRRSLSERLAHGLLRTGSLLQRGTTPAVTAQRS